MNKDAMRQASMTVEEYLTSLPSKGEDMLTPEDAMRQASMTVEEYLTSAIVRIDRHLGEGYAAKNPALIGAFIQAAAQDFHTTMLYQLHTKRMIPE